MWLVLAITVVWLSKTAAAQSVSDETSQNSGLLGLASLLPAARYGTPHLLQLVGTRVGFLNPFINGWFIGAYNGLVSGKPAETELGHMTASVSGADIPVTSPFVFDVLQSIDGDDRDADYSQLRDRGLGWTTSVVTVARLAVPSRLAQSVLISFTLLLYAVPVIGCVILGDYSGVGSIVYITFGLAARAVENATYVSIPPRPAPKKPMGLISKPSPSPSIVLLQSGGNDPVNIEDLVHPRLGVRMPQHAAACRIAYRAAMGVLLAGWLALLVASSHSSSSYTNGYIELATMAMSALGEVVMQQFVVDAVHVRTVRKYNAITTVAWLAHRQLLDTPGVPPNLLKLDTNESDLVNALFRRDQKDIVTDRLDQVRRVDRIQVFYDEDGPEREPEQQP
jgi:hypothetical protein